MRVFRYAMIAVCVAVLAGACAQKAEEGVVKGPKGDSEDATNAVLEVVVRDMLVNVPPGEEVYVSFGTSWQDRIDPPAGFLDRLEDIPATLRPVTEYGAQPERTPLLLIVHVAGRDGETAARVKATRYRLGVGAADGFTAQVTWSDGDWRLSGRSEHWLR